MDEEKCVGGRWEGKTTTGWWKLFEKKKEKQPTNPEFAPTCFVLVYLHARFIAARKTRFHNHITDKATTTLCGSGSVGFNGHVCEPDIIVLLSKLNPTCVEFHNENVPIYNTEWKVYNIHKKLCFSRTEYFDLISFILKKLAVILKLKCRFKFLDFCQARSIMIYCWKQQQRSIH